MKNITLQNWDKTLFVKNIATKTQIVFACIHDFEATTEKVFAVVSSEEIKRSEKFFHSQDKQQYLLGKYVLRTILSAATGIAATDIHFKTTANKKPTFAGQEFNITHAGSHIYIAFCPVAIGIDCEEIQHGFDCAAIVENCFSIEEQQRYYQAKKIEHFYTAWTRKEAVLKATGEGMSDGLKEVVVIADEITRNGGHYFLKSFQHDNYLVSFATLGMVYPAIFWRFSYE